ncbi:protein sprint-like isoform X2 [Limulus polyphemus]|uniref:Protein sprint-like isoform X2 n=1 Tax=Limulus polyphemus TaxID=6850 RepID=A0ABM1STB3_LIMPO|nr:protein sprint-like isoform X2 [Limulus polyphemus]
MDTPLNFWNLANDNKKKLNEIEQMLQDLDIDSRALNHNSYLHVSEPVNKDELIQDKAVLNGNQNGDFETVNFRNCWDHEDFKESRKQRPTGTATRYSTGRSFADKSTCKTVCQSTDGNRFLPCSPMCQVSSTPLCSDLSSHAHSVTDGILTTQPSTHSVSSFAVSWKEIENSSFSDDELPVLVIDLKERLNRTYPIWFLPDISREGATHLLQGKDEGNFIVRKSSTQNTYALTVRLPEGCKHIEHYLVEILPGNLFKLEGSQNIFSHLLLLVYHYCQCCDELPVKLCLPQALAQATTCAELSSLAHLGQEFWVSLLVQGAVGMHTTSVKKVESQENLPLTTFKPLTSPAETRESLKLGGSVLPIKPPVPPKPVISAKVPSSICPSHSVLQAVHQKVPNISESSSTTNSLSLTHCKSSSLLQTAKKLSTVESTVENMEVKREETLVSHYQQSDIVDNPIVYYRSSLDDKVSDYEDLEKFDMGNRSNVISNDNKHSFAKSLDPEKKEQKDTTCLLTFNRQNIALENFRKDLVSSSTQTYEAKEETPLTQPTEKVVRSNSFKIQNTATWRSNETTSMEYQGISSPFYALPVDAVDIVNNAHFSSSVTPSLTSTVFTPLQDQLKTRNCLRDSFTTDENSLSASREKIHSNPLVSSQSYNSKTENPIQFSNEQKKPKDCAVENRNIQVSLQCTNEKLNIPVKSRCSFKKRAHHQEWASDTSWEWCDHGDEEEKELQDSESECELSEPMFRNYKQQKHTEYENLKRNKDLEDNQPADNIDDTSTVFSEPWDQKICYRFLHSAPETYIGKEDVTEKENPEQTMKNNQLKNVKIETPTSSDESRHSSSVNSETDSNTDDQIWNYPTIPADGHMTGNNDNVQTIGHITAALQNIHTPQGEVIRNYIFRLANDKSTLFAKQIVSFIECTRESRQVNPEDNLRLIRQFMSGLSNFLVKNGEGKFAELIKQEQGKLQADKFLNIDLIIEETLHELVIKPLKEYIYQLFKNEYTRDGSLQLLTESIKYAKTKTPQELGIRDELQPPDSTGLDIVKTYFKRMENEHSPLRKLENLLGAMSSICNNVHGNRKSQGNDHASLGADDFLPIFIYVLAQCELISAEIEANYMWGLLHSSWHSGEGGYYLTTLSGAVHAIKQLQLESKRILRKPAISFFSPIKQPEEKIRLPSVGDLQSCMKILFPEESSGDIRYKTLPVKPNMTTREVCRMAASKFCVTNPQDYGLFKLVGEVETKLEGGECPQTVKDEGVVSGQESLFIYRRCDGKFVWPCWSKF